MKKKTKTVKAWAIVGRDDKISDQFHTARGCFYFRVYKTAETARNQLYKIASEIPAKIVPCTISYTI